MNTMNDSELVSAVHFKMVSKMNIVETEDRKYRILVTLRKLEGGMNALKSHPAKDWAVLGRLVELEAEPGEKTVITTRNTEREWANLDRLVRHIHTSYGPIPAIHLTLYFATPSAESIVKKLKEGAYKHDTKND